MYWPYLVVFVVLGAMLLFSVRNRRRQAAQQQELTRHIGFGSEVMTTSGLYGTVVSSNEDGESVQLAIAPGVEVKWARAALREVNSLPDRYRGAAASADESGKEGEQGGSDAPGAKGR